MAFQCERQLLRRKTAAVVGDQEARKAALVGLHLDARGAGVERVLHQLLHRAGGALHHLACGDAIDGFGGQAADGHGDDS